MRIRPRFKAWKGGKCPVNMNTTVQIILYNDIRLVLTGTLAFLFNWDSDGPNRIVAYRVLREAL